MITSRNILSPWHLAASVAVLSLPMATTAAEPAATPASLRCEYLVNPTAIEEPAPHLSWIIESSSRGWRQTAYRVVVASSAAKPGARLVAAA